MQIRIGYSKSEIWNCPNNLINQLFKVFTYTNKSISYQYSKLLKGKHRTIWGIMNRQFVDKNAAEAIYEEQLQKIKNKRKICLLSLADNVITVPTGLIKKTCVFLNEQGLKEGKDYYIVDTRIKPIECVSYVVKEAMTKLWPFQQEALKQCLIHQQGIIEAGTGSGKTLILQELIRNLGVKTLFVTPTLSIMNQTIKRFKKYFGTDKIGVYGGGKRQIKHITIGCAASVSDSAAEEWSDVQLLIVDEIHHIAAPTFEKICYDVVPNAYYRINATATNYRADGADLAVEAAGFPTIFQYSVEQGIAERYLAKPIFLMFNIPFSDNRYQGESALLCYQRHIMNNSLFNKIVINQINAFASEGKRVLVLVREKDHGNYIQQYVANSIFVRNKEGKETVGYIAPRIDPDIAVKQFNEGKIKCLIGTSIIGEGTDIVPVDVLFLLTGGSSKVSVIQNIGRGLRKCEGKSHVVVIDYIYSCHKMLQRHSWMRYNYYKDINTVKLFNMDRDGNIEEFKYETI